MKQETQDRCKTKSVAEFEEAAFSAMVQYSYWGKKYKAASDQAEEIEKRIFDIDAKIEAIKALPESHTVESKSRVKELKGDRVKYAKQMDMVREPLKKLFEKATAWREESMKYLELAEEAKALKLDTPEEMDAKKKATKKETNGSSDMVK